MAGKEREGGRERDVGVRERRRKKERKGEMSEKVSAEVLEANTYG